jgi:hypothetical protein
VPWQQRYACGGFVVQDTIKEAVEKDTVAHPPGHDYIHLSHCMRHAPVAGLGMAAVIAIRQPANTNAMPGHAWQSDTANMVRMGCAGIRSNDVHVLCMAVHVRANRCSTLVKGANDGVIVQRSLTRDPKGAVHLALNDSDDVAHAIVFYKLQWRGV